MNNSARPLSNEQLLQVLTLPNYATAIHIGEDATIQYANDAMLAVWGKGKSVIGKSLEDALPELKGQPFIDLFKKVWNEGITISGTNTAAELEVDGDLQTFYFDFEYRAVKNEQGKVYCILHTANNVTERVLSFEREQNLIEELRASNEELLAANEEIRAANEEIRAANEEISAANEEISAANEELNAANEELSESQQHLRTLYDELAESDSRFRSMVKQAPIGICIIRASDLFIPDVNDAYLELVGKQRDELENHTIWEAIPEAAEVYAPIMDGVIRTGIPFIAKEHELVLVRNGVPEKVMVDFVYEPIKQNEKVTAIMVLAIEVTEKVTARRNIEEMEERARLAVEAAEIGTFDLDLISNVMLTSERFNQIFGYDHHVDRDLFVAVIHPDDRSARTLAHNEAMETGRLFYEVRAIHPDNSVHWIRVQGKVYYDATGKPMRILGTLLDITEFRRLQQQKDDFISIASHELKTPITSLKASLQLLDRMKHDPALNVLPRLVDQSTRSMQKISALVEDLLNVSRTNQTQIQLKKTTFNITEMINACCSHVRLSGKHDLVISGDKQLTVHADEHAIDQVIVNLVNNAVKYAPESKEINIHIEKQDDLARISVTDSGPGIAAEKLPHLFDRYYQADSSGFQNSGLGLGLYICAEIIKRHGGEIGVNSQLGHGCTFWFSIPLE